MTTINLRWKGQLSLIRQFYRRYDDLWNIILHNDALKDIVLIIFDIFSPNSVLFTDKYLDSIVEGL